MNRSRTFILLGGVLLLAAVLMVVVLGQQQPAPTPVVVPTPIEIPTTDIYVAAQNISRGSVIGPDAVIPFKWPNASLAPGMAITNQAQIVGKIARTDIMRLQPIMPDLITSAPGDLAKVGCDAALGIPQGKVAVAFPINQISGVGYAIGRGDHVDVMVAFSVVDVDQDNQFPNVPFNRNLQNDLLAAGADPKTITDQTLTANGAAMAQVLQRPNAQYLPRLVTQLTIQNIEVLNVGDWPAQCPQIKSTPVPSPDQTPVPTPPAPVGTPTPTPPRPTILILLVDHQQALVLQWLRNANVSIELAMRNPDDLAPVATDAVHYPFILSTFAIPKPPKTDTYIQQPTPEAVK